MYIETGMLLARLFESSWPARLHLCQEREDWSAIAGFRRSRGSAIIMLHATQYRKRDQAARLPLRANDRGDIGSGGLVTELH